MTSNLQKIIKELREAANRIDKSEYSVERVDFENDITYEVRTKDSDGFHVIFRESDSLEYKISPKHQSHFYVLAANHLSTLLTALEIQGEALEYVENWNNWQTQPNISKKAKDAISQVERLFEKDGGKVADE